MKEPQASLVIKCSRHHRSNGGLRLKLETANESKIVGWSYDYSQTWKNAIAFIGIAPVSMSYGKDCEYLVFSHEDHEKVIAALS